MMTTNLNMNLNLTLNVVNITLCNIRRPEGSNLFSEIDS